jgi:L,D-peptidoglycan transpeptidase YkuD (ErfK/YbiS/YcfS/YnhG family)
MKPLPFASVLLPVTAALVVAVAGPAARAQGHPCSANLAASLSSTGSVLQLITVEAPRLSATVASVRLWQRFRSCWLPTAGPWPARLGINGLSDHHREGDGTTPSGAYTLGPIIYGIAPDPGVHYRYHRLVCGDWWNEDPTSHTYNTFEHVRCGTRPLFRGASEALWTETTAYQHFLVIEYNTRPSVPGRGSGIFVHDDLGQPTNGCISLLPTDLDKLLRWLLPADRPQIVIGTSAEIRRF